MHDKNTKTQTRLALVLILMSGASTVEATPISSTSTAPDALDALPQNSLWQAGGMISDSFACYPFSWDITSTQAASPEWPAINIDVGNEALGQDILAIRRVAGEYLDSPLSPQSPLWEGLADIAAPGIGIGSTHPRHATSSQKPPSPPTPSMARPAPWLGIRAA